MRVGVSGFAVGNPAGLGRASRTFILALLAARPDWELHLYLKSPEYLRRLREEADSETRAFVDRLEIHYPPLLLAAANRVVLEELDLPRQFGPLKLDAFLGLDFTLPGRRLAPLEAAVIYDLLPFTRPETVSWRARMLYRRGIKRAVKRGARLLCISDCTQRELAQQFSGQRLDSQVIRLALSPAVWSNALRAAEQDHTMQVRGSLATLIDPGRYLLYVGARGRRKNVDLLVAAYRELVAQWDYHGALVLAGGDGRYHSLPETRVGEQQVALQPVGMQLPDMGGGEGGRDGDAARIHDIGYVNDFDLSQLYRNADLLVNLSVEEGYGYPVLEALAHGTPALVTRGSAMEEISRRGIVSTGLDEQAVQAALSAALDALPQLRQELRADPQEFNQFARLGHELAAALEDAATQEK